MRISVCRAPYTPSLLRWRSSCEFHLIFCAVAFVLCRGRHHRSREGDRFFKVYCRVAGCLFSRAYAASCTPGSWHERAAHRRSELGWRFLRVDCFVDRALSELHKSEMSLHGL